jgi:hypothetical protein
MREGWEESQKRQPTVNTLCEMNVHRLETRNGGEIGWHKSNDSTRGFVYMPNLHGFTILKFTAVKAESMFGRG